MNCAMPEQIFISYSHEDEGWMEMFQRKLLGIARPSFTTWSDRSIAPGDEWRAAIQKRLESATIALILVSDHFLTSEFIKTVELPKILDRAHSGELKLFWVPVTSTTVKYTELNEFQACCPADQPLDLLPQGEQSKVIADICDLIYSHCQEVLKSSNDRQDQLKGAVRQAIPTDSDLEIKEMISWGTHSIIYHGEMEGRDVAVKVLLDSPLRQHERHFREVARLAENHTHPCFIRVRKVYVDTHPQCIVMDYVPGPTLADVLQLNGPFSIDDTIRLIREITEALVEYHDNGLAYGPLDPGELQYDGELVRLSPLSISSSIAQDDTLNGSFPHDSRAATYLCPEAYCGRTRTSLSDQYALGLLAFEMLQGSPPCRISCPADLEKKSAFFREPSAYAGSWKEQHPEFAKIIFRMLHQDPLQRWPSMEVVMSTLESVAPANVALAKASYLKHCHKQADFFAEFYRRFFARCPEAAGSFKNLDGQYMKLDNAVNYLLNFKPSAVPQEITPLDPTAEQHQQMNVSGQQFDAFLATFLETLKEFRQLDEKTMAAWQSVLAPGFEYLKSHCCAKQVA